MFGSFACKMNEMITNVVTDQSINQEIISKNAHGKELAKAGGYKGTMALVIRLLL